MDLFFYFISTSFYNARNIFFKLFLKKPQGVSAVAYFILFLRRHFGVAAGITYKQRVITETAAAVAFLCHVAFALAPYGEFSAVGENAGNSGYKGGGSFIFRHALQRRQKLFVIGRIGGAAA